MGILEDIREYKPYNEHEEKDKEIIIHCLENEPDIFTRDNKLVHMTSSAWITNKDHTKILMAYHNIYNSFSWLGGHNDGNENCLEVAIKEAKEESGISNIKALIDKIFSLEVLTVDGHIKKGEYVSSHIHLNVTYLLEADDEEELKVKEDENSAVKWFLKDEAVMASNEPWFRENVYSKLNNKLEEFYENN